MGDEQKPISRTLELMLKRSVSVSKCSASQKCYSGLYELLQSASCTYFISVLNNQLSPGFV